ncbi:MAG TPA: hypothetical protein VLW44_08765 [Streptosporangiaceae bacterium]|nr:hypothetical protein [Streptosporangiaceae bacterium]
MAPEIKLVAFLVLAVAIFLGARAAGSLVGPVVSVDAPPGGSSAPVNTGGMHMGLGQSMNVTPSRP